MRYIHIIIRMSRKRKTNLSFAGRMTEDSNGGIWIATEGGGVNYLDKKRKLLLNTNMMQLKILLHLIRFRVYF